MDGDDFIQMHLMMQRDAEREQNIILEEIDNDLTKMNEISIQMNNELQYQDDVIDSIGYLVEDAENRVKKATKEVDEVTSSDSEHEYCCVLIPVLLMIIAGLIFLIVYV
jgi:hypothetical protein